MKKFTIILSVLIAMTIETNAQIPNNGFELWNNMGSYSVPQDYLTTNTSASGPFYSVTKVTDHYPLSIGTYSIRIENNPSLLPNLVACGIILQNRHYPIIAGPGPYFPIVGHPTSLTGYYKFIPQNNDTMSIQIQLYNAGNTVSNGKFDPTTAASNWTSFSIPLTVYASADSGSILISAYSAIAPPPECVPHGNSVLYIDNLNFDFLITSVSDEISENSTFSLYPNPASDIVTLNISNTNPEDFKINIYNLMGDLVGSETMKQNQQQINTGDLSNGVYLVTIKSNELTKTQKLIIQR